MTQWRHYFLGALLLTYSFARAQTGGGGYEVISNLQDLAVYKGAAQVIFVTDSSNGGYFVYRDWARPDNGVAYKSTEKGKCWVRQYDALLGVNLTWFTSNGEDDADALKRAFNYPKVRLNKSIQANSKTKFPSERTIEVMPGCTITNTDTLPLKFNSSLIATDYQYIFPNGGPVLFGSTAVPYVSVCWFGAVADCKGFQEGDGTDNTAAIARALKAADYVSDLYLPPTASNLSYRITSTLSIAKKLHFFSFTFRGGGNTLTHNASDRASTIFADFSAGAAINVQGSRRVYLSNFCLVGKNQMPKRLAGYNDPIGNSDSVEVPGSYLSPGLKHSYTGITTDGDPDSKVLSADIVFSDLVIEYFYLGVGISQAGKVQGDRMRIQNSQINYCVFGVSLGNHQNRSCHFMNLDMMRVWCGITNNSFGDKTGSVFQMTGGQWCNVYKCFQIQPSYLGQCVISGLYAEAIGWIGWIGDNHPNNSSLLFTGCHFMIRDESQHIGYAFKAPFYTLTTAGNVTFQSCNFWDGRRYIAMRSASTRSEFAGATIRLNGCSIHHCSDMHVLGNNIIENTYLIPESNTIDYNRNIMVNFDRRQRVNTGFSPQSLISGTEATTAQSSTMSSTATITRKIPRFYTTADLTNHITITYQRHDTIIFQYDDYASDNFFIHVLPEDLIGTALKKGSPDAIDNPTISVIDHNPKKREIAAVTRTADLQLGKMALYTNGFFTTVAVAGRIVAGSDRIASVNNIDLMRRGDFITFSGAKGAYRVKQVLADDTTLVLTQPIAEAINDQVELINEVITKNDALPALDVIKTIAADYIVASTDKTIIVKNATKDVTLSLPAAPATGTVFHIKRSGGDKKVVVQAPGTAGLDDKLNVTLSAPYQYLSVQFDGKGYILLNSP